MRALIWHAAAVLICISILFVWTIVPHAAAEAQIIIRNIDHTESSDPMTEHPDPIGKAKLIFIVDKAENKNLYRFRVNCVNCFLSEDEWYTTGISKLCCPVMESAWNNGASYGAFPDAYANSRCLGRSPFPICAVVFMSEDCSALTAVSDRQMYSRLALRWREPVLGSRQDRKKGALALDESYQLDRGNGGENHSESSYPSRKFGDGIRMVKPPVPPRRFGWVVLVAGVLAGAGSMSFLFGPHQISSFGSIFGILAYMVAPILVFIGLAILW